MQGAATISRGNHKRAGTGSRWPLEIAGTIAAVAVALWLRHLLGPVLGDRLPFIFVVITMIGVAWMCGAAAYILGAVLGLVGTVWLFLLPIGGFGPGDIGDWLQVLMYALLSAALGVFAFWGRAARARAREAEKIYRASFELAAVGKSHIDPATGRFMQVNRKLCEMLGRSEGDLVGRSAEEVVEPEDWERGAAGLRSLAAGETQHYSASLRLRRADGAVVWGVLHAALLRNDEGRPERIIAVVQDTTAEREASEALRRREEEMRILTDALPVLISYVDRDLCYRFNNRAYEEWFGIPADSLRGRHVRAVLSEESLEKMMPRIRRVLAGEVVRCEERVMYPAAGERWIAVTYVPDVGAGGEVSGYFALIEDVSDRKRAQQAREEADQRLRAALRAGRMVAWEYDAATDRVTQSENAAEIFGLLGDEGAGEGAFWRERIAVPDLRSHTATINAAARELVSGRGDGSYVSRYRFRRPVDGETIWLEDRGHVACDGAGAIVRAYGLVADVTVRMRAEERARQLGERFRIALQHSPVTAFAQDRDLKYTWVYSGDPTFKPEAIVGRTDRDLTTAEDAAELEKFKRLVLESGRPLRVEISVAVADGRRAYDLSIEPDFGAFGEIMGITGSAVDITEHRRFTEELRRSEGRFRTLADNAPVLIWMSDSEGRLEFVNRACLEFAGRGLTEAQGRPWHADVHPEDVEALRGIYDAAAGAGERFSARYRVRRADGEYRWVQTEGEPRRGDGDGARGRLRGFIASTVDITEIELAREALREHRDALELLVERRTAELERSHQALRLSERMASIGTLSAGLGHDMGNLLLPIRMRLDGIADGGLTPEQGEHLAAIRKCMEYLQRLTHGLRLLALDPEAPGAGDVSTDPAAWWPDTQPLLRNALPPGTELLFDADPGVPPVRLSRSALTQAVFNLVQNAGEALRGREGGCVRIRVLAAGDGVGVRIEDNGPGMSEEVRRRCLEPFFTTKTRGISTGLGLTLVHGIVKGCGGRLEIESHDGLGSAFILTLPAAASEATESADVGGAELAAVSLTDLRLSSYVGVLLTPLGFTVQPGSGADGARLWISGSEQLDAAAAEGFLRRDPRNRIVVIGEAVQGIADARVAVVPRESRPSEIRKAVCAAAVACRNGAGVGGRSVRLELADEPETLQR